MARKIYSVKDLQSHKQEQISRRKMFEMANELDPGEYIALYSLPENVFELLDAQHQGRTIAPANTTGYRFEGWKTREKKEGYKGWICFKPKDPKNNPWSSSADIIPLGETNWTVAELFMEGHNSLRDKNPDKMYEAAMAENEDKLKFAAICRLPATEPSEDFPNPKERMVLAVWKK